MKKIAEIDCGCENNCGKRIKIYWYKKQLIAKSHGKEHVIEQHYSHSTKAQAVEDLIAWYDNPSWNLELVA
jgi:hypothetical protein